ncbi:F0F1 ATP synthase subunit A [Helicobacter sp. MIT 14-3879]|uniref:F0F1 ATP synthase subunit A n=1 Tax=Helicobacter sp. MIT 14-3879 TaxID=2040649 RepID=UPI000E1EC279|nr:F0F1 ATP synthase subunit A [Helicobacter sp. MIT 14-3879]RDU63967.1 F0F1 ATP synthase subunit A [Helicobacter sp. MIT 14-3879]
MAEESVSLDEKIFTFASLINPNHDFIIGFYTFIIFLIALLFAKLATKRLELVPNGFQNVAEAFLSGIIFFAKDAIGEKLARKYIPLTATLALFVFLSNMIGIIPGFEAPSSSLSFTLVLALIVFFYYHFEGIRENGFIRYFGHFAGPVKLISPLMFPVELISHFSRVISLSFRLFGNIKGDDIFLLVMLMLAPWLAPLPAFAILTFMAFLQAFIFMILTYVYLAGAVILDEESH